MLTKGLAGQTVGAKVECKLNDVNHIVELLAIRNPPPAEVVPPAGDVVQIGDVKVNADGSQETTYERIPAGTTVH
jgi:hypothetical protein